MAAELKVDSEALSDYGRLFEGFGHSNVTHTGEGTKTACGRTSDMEGLLDLIAPGIKLVADAFGDHYREVGTVIAQSGANMQVVAKNYANLDHSVAEGLDKDAATASGGHDNPFGSGGAWTDTYSSVDDYPADADPAQAIRDDMAIDVQAIDWVFAKCTGHHITEPIDKLVGNWTALTARGRSWNDVSTNLHQHGDDVLHNAGVVDGIWDGEAATSFQAYATHMGDGLHAESELPLGIKSALDTLATEWESLYQQAVDLLQEVIHDVEIGAAALAAGWWCGVGEAVAAKKCQEALVAFWRAFRIVWRVHSIIKNADRVVRGFEALKDAVHLATHLPQAIEGEVVKLKDLMAELGSVPTHLDDLSHLGDTPTRAYGGPDDPGVS